MLGAIKLSRVESRPSHLEISHFITAHRQIENEPVFVIVGIASISKSTF